MVKRWILGAKTLKTKEKHTSIQNKKIVVYDIIYMDETSMQVFVVQKTDCSEEAGEDPQCERRDYNRNAPSHCSESTLLWWQISSEQVVCSWFSTTLDTWNQAHLLFIFEVEPSDGEPLEVKPLEVKAFTSGSFFKMTKMQKCQSCVLQSVWPAWHSEFYPWQKYRRQKQIHTTTSITNKHYGKDACPSIHFT